MRSSGSRGCEPREAIAETLDVLEHRDQHRALGAEQIVWRRQADAGFRRQRPHRQSGIAGLPDQVARRLHDPQPPFRLCLLAPLLHGSNLCPVAHDSR